MTAFAVVVLALIPSGAPFSAAAIAPEPNGVFGPRRVLAFYYAWYANPDVSGRWSHWEKVDALRKDIGSSTHYPIAGAYDSSDPAVIDRQMRQMAEVGIDGPIVSWWGPGAFDSDRVMPSILDAASRHGRVVTAYYETIPSGGDLIGRAASDLIALIRSHADHPAWLKVGERPVVFLYIRVLDQLGDLERWVDVRERVRVATGSEPFLIGDAVSHEAAEVFDGLHHYNTADRLAGLEVGDIRHRLQSLATLDTAIARKANRLICGTVIPGYDDTKIRTPGLAIPRFDGATFAAGFEAATASGVDWALITSWNEWHEGSEMEPSIEMGDRELQATRDLVGKFRLGRWQGAENTTASLEWREFARTWTGGTIGLMGGTGLGTAGTELALSGLPMRVVSVRDLCRGAIETDESSILVYVGGETIQADYGERWTLPEALEHHFRRGGVLIVASPEAWPFYRDRSSGRTAWSHVLGLPLAQGFESPPLEEIRFVFEGRLRRFGSTPYPKSGDRRFRPCLTSSDNQRSIESLADLRSPDGKSFGAAVTVIRGESESRSPIRMIYVAAPVWTSVDRGAFLRALLEEAESLRDPSIKRER